MSVWSKLWLAWSVLGLLTATAIAVAVEVGAPIHPHVWRWWVVPGLFAGGTLELVALFNDRRHDTLSHHVWTLRDREGLGSLILAVLAWLAWFLGTGDPWPAAGVFFLLWCMVHFAFEGSEDHG